MNERGKDSNESSEREDRLPPELGDNLRWDELYPGLPTVEVARLEEDPIFWMRFRHDEWFEGEWSEGKTAWFYMAGFSMDGLPTTMSILSVSQFLRGYDGRFYGLVVYESERRMQWREFDEDYFDDSGPVQFHFTLDESWRARRFSEVVKDHPGYTLTT
jgi:hypothetical protein